MAEQAKRLTITKKVAIIRWLIRNEEWVVANRPSHVDAAEHIGKQLGFPISHATIGEMARSGELGYDWPNPAKSTSHLPRTISYAGLCSKVRKLEEQVASMMDALGVR